MATNNQQNSKRTNTITGKVILKESGLGIPDLLIVIYDKDAEVILRGADGNPSPRRRRRATSATTTNNLGDRIGSVLTAADGTFSLSFEKDEFREPDPEDQKPDLFLMVMAPEDADGNGAPKILYNAFLREDAGNKEAYFIRLTKSQLEKAEITVPNVEDENVEQRVKSYRSAQQSKIKLNRGIAEFHKEVLDPHVEEKEIFRLKIRDSIVPVLTAATGNGVVVNEGEKIRDKANEIVDKGIFLANRQFDESKGVPVTLYLTPDDKTKLQPFFNNAVNGVATIPESEIKPILLRANNSEDVGTLLVNNNPIAKYCREKTFEEKCAVEHLEGSINDHNHNNGNSGGGSNGSDADNSSDAVITDNDILIYTNRLIADMTSPDNLAKPTRPSKADVEKSLSEFSLQRSPADVPAYYDFHSLQIAFEHVWKQLFDEEIINSGYQLQQGIKNKTGLDPLLLNNLSIDSIRGLVLTANVSLFMELPPNVAAQFEITKEEWSELSVSYKNHLSVLAARINNLLYKPVSNSGSQGWFENLSDFLGGSNVSSGQSALVPRQLSLSEERLKQFLIEQGERIIDSVRHDDYYTMHKTLRDLQERLSGKYEYTIFAADKDYCTVNFGILNTYRQKWEPLNYQVGKLVKTIPLAPKEERKYSLKINRHLKQSEKEARKNNTSFSNKQNETSRLEGEIVAKALNKTNFNLTTEGTYNIGISKGDSKTSLGVDAQNESQQTRKDFKEATLESIQDIKNELSFEITSEETSDYEAVDSGTIINPNDELAVTYLFYELQRRYRISEQLYRVMPTVLVAQPVPQPNEITEAWVISNDWIINRFLLDDSFKSSLDYLSAKSVGDDFALRELRRNLRQQRNLVETLKLELSLVRADADNRYRALERAVRDRIKEEDEEETDGWFSDVGDFFGGGGQSPEAAKARELAAKDAQQVAAEKAEKMAAAVRQEVDTLHKLTADYNKTLRDHLDNETRVKRLLTHIRNNIIYYMQAIWSMEPPDQRFLRLRNVEVPDLELDASGRTYKVKIEPSEEADIFAIFRPEGTTKHKATVSGKLKKSVPNEPLKTKSLIEVADLDKPMGFKGNYMIFPMKEHNALTEFMAAPFVDSAFGAMDPDQLSNINLNEFSEFICCLHDHEPERFEALKPVLHEWLKQLLADPLRNGDEAVIPSGSLYIEIYPSGHTLLEDFKLRHRELDVQKVRTEVLKAKMENLRLAARLVNHEREDPDIDKKIVVEGKGINIDIDPDNN